MLRSACLLIISAATSTALVLGVASLPGGERVSQSLNSTAERWLNVPFETQLVSELSQLQHPGQSELMIQLVMQHIAKDARLARYNEVSTRPPAGWQADASLPNLAMKSDQTLQALQENNLVTIKPSQPLFDKAETENLNGWAALVCFLGAIFWVSLRRG